MTTILETTTDRAGNTSQLEAGCHAASAVPTAAGAAPARRRFMRAAFCAPAVAVAAAAAGSAPRTAAAVGDAAAESRTCSTYHETAHIRTYYDLARY